MVKANPSQPYPAEFQAVANEVSRIKTAVPLDRELVVTRKGTESDVSSYMAQYKKRTWILRCMKCGSDFDVDVYSSESVLITSRRTGYPNCGHVTQLTDPERLESAIKVHHLADAYFTKPAALLDLTKAIEKLLIRPEACPQ